MTQMYEAFPEFPGGAAAFWDYSEATPYSIALHNSWYSDVAWAMYGPAPAGANIVLNSPTSSSFHIISNAVWLRVGSIQNLSTDTMFTYYNNPDTVMVFPFGYQDSFYNSFTSVLLYDNVEFCSETDTFIADGWGTLKMPGGAVYNDVLRVKKRTKRSFEDTTGYQLNHRIICYSYYQPGFHEPLLEQYIWQYTVNDDSLITDASHLLVRSFYNSLQVPQTQSNMRYLSVYPSPARGHFTVSLPNSVVVVTDLNGRVLYRQQTTEAGTVDCRHWPAGTYLIYATANDGTIYTGKVLLQ